MYLQSVIDCHSRYAWGHLYASKLPVTAVHVLNSDVLPLFEKHGVPIMTVLSANGREYCGRPDRHPHELFLQLEGIEHRTTKVRPASEQRFCGAPGLHASGRAFPDQRPHQVVESVEEMQKDLDEYLTIYTTKRPHQGRNMKGRTPQKAFMDGLKGLKVKPPKASNRKAA